MDVGRLVAVKRNEKESVRAFSQDRQHSIEFYLKPSRIFNRTDAMAF
jgi:hypothetical protein